MKTFVRAILLLLIAFAFASSNSADAGPTRYAAIAFSPETGAYGYGNGFASKAGAIQRAQIECGGPDMVTKWCKNAWIALAVSDDGGYGWAWAKTAAAARAAAVENCLEQNDTARVVICVSSHR